MYRRVRELGDKRQSVNVCVCVRAGEHRHRWGASVPFSGSKCATPPTVSTTSDSLLKGTVTSTLSCAMHYYPPRLTYAAFVRLELCE